MTAGKLAQLATRGRSSRVVASEAKRELAWMNNEMGGVHLVKIRPLIQVSIKQDTINCNVWQWQQHAPQLLPQPVTHADLFISRSPNTTNTTQQFAVPSFRRQTAETSDRTGNRGINDFNVMVHHPIIRVPDQMTATTPPTNLATVSLHHMTTPTQHVTQPVGVHRSSSHAMRRVSMIHNNEH